MNENNTSLLAAFGISMGFSADDMHDMATAMRAAMPENEIVSPLGAVSDVAKGMDTMTLFMGAILFGYILHAYEGIDVSAALNNDNQKT